MVVLVVKRDSTALFLYGAQLSDLAAAVTADLVAIFNGTLKVQRMVEHLKDLARHGIAKSPETRGLLEDQIKELKLTDSEAEERCVPSGETVECLDPMGRRCGTAPSEEMAAMLTKTAEEALAMVSREKAVANVHLSMTDVREAVAVMKGAVSIVYPMGLPDYDPFKMEADNAEEDIPQAQAPMDPAETTLWFANNELEPSKPLSDRMGKNEKTKVIVKLSTKKIGRPVADPLLSDAQEKILMKQQWERMEELRKMAKDDDDSYLDSQWADGNALKKKFNGLSDISWK